MGSKTNKEHVNRYRVWSQAVWGEAWGSVQLDAPGGRQTRQLGVRCRSVTAAGGGGWGPFGVKGLSAKQEWERAGLLPGCWSDDCHQLLRGSPACVEEQGLACGVG